MRLIALIPVMLCALTLPALARDATGPVVTVGNGLATAPTAWLGATPHFVLMGTVAGKALDIQFADIAKAADIAEFQGKREYLMRDGGYAYLDFEIGLQAVIGGIERSIEIEFASDDFRASPVPGAFELVAEEFPKGAKASVEVSLEWEAGGVTVNDEILGWTGQLGLAQDSGTADDKGLMPDGLIAGFASGTLNGEAFALSFTVPVAEYEIED